MRLILRNEIGHLGEVGDVVEVADGYGLNYLIPKGYAIHATANTLRASQHEQRLREVQVDVARRRANEAAAQFSGVEIEFIMRAGEDGRLFGSVTNRDIEKELLERGLEVTRRRILLPEPIRKIGEYDVPIRIHAEVKAEVKVQVVAAETDEGADHAAEEKTAAQGEAAAEEKREDGEAVQAETSFGEDAEKE
jgi:large subunit ribosomal protein L9